MCPRELGRPGCTDREERNKTNLAVEVEEVKREETDADLNVFHLHILAFPFTQFLERHELVLFDIECNGFGVQNECLHGILYALESS